MSMLNLVPAELRATFCAATHTLPTPADVHAQQIASQIAEERLTLAVLQHKLHDVADFAVQLSLATPLDHFDLAEVLEHIDNARGAVRMLMLHDGTNEGPGSAPRGGLEVPR